MAQALDPDTSLSSYPLFRVRTLTSEDDWPEPPVCYLFDVLFALRGSIPDSWCVDHRSYLRVEKTLLQIGAVCGN